MRCETETGRVSIQNMKNGEPRLIIKGFIGREVVLDFLRCLLPTYSATENLICALAEGYDTISNLAQYGGLIARGGQLVIDIRKAEFKSSETLNELQEKSIISREVMFIKNQSIIFRKGSIPGKVILIKENLRNQLCYQTDHNGNYTPCYLGEDNQPKQLEDLNLALGRYMSKLYENHGVQSSYSLSTRMAVREILLEITISEGKHIQ